MSEKILFDVDERINSIKNSLKEIGTNFEVTTPKDESKNSIKTRQKNPEISSPKSSKKLKKNAYVSNYVAFGNTEELDSSSDEIISPKKVTFDPTATEIFSKNLEFKGSTLTKDSYFQEISDLQQQLIREKERNLHLESLLSQKEEELAQLNSSQEILQKHLDLKCKNQTDSEKIIEDLKQEIVNLNTLVTKYHSAISEFETFHKEYEMNNSYKHKDIENYQQQISLLQQEILELNQKISLKDSEIQNIQLSNRELERENTNFGKFIKKTREKSAKSPSERKLKEKVKSLKQINDNLKDEIKKRPTEHVLKDTEKKLADLEKIVSEYCGKKVASDKKVIGSLMNLLKVQKSSEIYAKVQEISRTGNGKGLELSKKLRGLIIKYSPPGTFSKLPSDKKVLSWIKRLIEEYLLKVKQEEYNMKNLEAFKRCMRIMETTFPEDLVMKIEEIKGKA